MKQGNEHHCMGKSHWEMYGKMALGNLGKYWKKWKSDGMEFAYHNAGKLENIITP